MLHRMTYAKRKCSNNRLLLMTFFRPTNSCSVLGVLTAIVRVRIQRVCKVPFINEIIPLGRIYLCVFSRSFNYKMFKCLLFLPLVLSTSSFYLSTFSSVFPSSIFFLFLFSFVSSFHFLLFLFLLSSYT